MLLTVRHVGLGLLALGGLAVLQVFISSIYNLFFHPLRNIPGPTLAKVSRLWSRIGNFSGRKSERIHAAHVAYGPVVRVGPNELSFSEPQAAQDIYTSNEFAKENSFYVCCTIHDWFDSVLTWPGTASQTDLSRESSVQFQVRRGVA